MPIQRSCPICFCSEGAPVGSMPSPTRPMDIVCCKGCGLVFVNPMYTNAEKEDASPQVRLLHRSRSQEQAGAAFDHSTRRMRRCIDLLAAHIQPGQEVLEVGSGDGALLALLQGLGARPTGLDMDQGSAEEASRRLGVPVYTGTFEDLALPDGSFDAVVLVHLIEHFFEPVEMLRKVRRLLRPGGVIFLETPNILRPKVGPGRVFSFAHNYHFSPRSLALALHAAGFCCTALRAFRRDSVQVVARAAEPAALGPAPRPDSWAKVQRAIRGHRLRYLTSLQFLWRKLPWLKDWLMYRPRRDLRDADLARWLAGPAPQPA